jgi:hypothetical protein
MAVPSPFYFFPLPLVATPGEVLEPLPTLPGDVPEPLLTVPGDVPRRTANGRRGAFLLDDALFLCALTAFFFGCFLAIDHLTC